MDLEKIATEIPEKVKIKLTVKIKLKSFSITLLDSCGANVNSFKNNLNFEFIIFSFLGQSGSSQEQTSSGDGIPRMSLEQAVMTREERKIKELDDEEYKDYTKL